MMRRFLPLILAAVLPGSGRAGVVSGPARSTAGGGFGPAASAGGFTRPEFLRALDLHIGRLSLSLGSTLPGSAAPAPAHSASPGAAENRVLDAAEYLSRAAWAHQPAGAASPEGAAARFLGGVLVDPEERSAASRMLRESGELGAELAGKLDSLGRAGERLAPLRVLGKDLRSGPRGEETARLLESLFDGGTLRPESGVAVPRPLSTRWGVRLAAPEEFVDFAARRFYAGRVESAGGAGVIQRDRPPAGLRERLAARFPRLLGWLAPRAVPDDQTLHDRMALSPLTNAEREQAIIDIFRQGGAAEADIRLQDIGRGQHNVVVVKKGRSDRVVVVGGHFDKVQRGRGTIDNWTGATMVANLYQALSGVETDATFVFIAFGREEEGLVGSRAYVAGLNAAERAKIDAMINLDTLAVDGTFSWENNSDRPLLEKILRVAREGGFAHAPMRLSGGDSDSSSFRRAGILAMTVLGASNAVIWDIIHSDNDTMKWFSLPHYKNAYLLTLALLKKLDVEPARGGRLADLSTDWTRQLLRPAAN